MKIIDLKSEVVVSDPGQLTPQVKIGNVLPGNYRVNAKVVSGKFGKEVSLLGVLHEDYFKTPKNWVWYPINLKTETGRMGIFSEGSYQNDAYFEDSDNWLYCINKHIFKSEEKWSVYARGAMLLVGPENNNFCLYLAKNQRKQVVGFMIDFYLEGQENDLVFNEFGFHMEAKEIEF
jgi:hypothetical protein